MIYIKALLGIHFYICLLLFLEMCLIIVIYFILCFSKPIIIIEKPVKAVKKL